MSIEVQRLSGEPVVEGGLPCSGGDGGGKLWGWGVVEGWLGLRAEGCSTSTAAFVQCVIAACRSN